ncbi:hypothetical protein GCM10020360_16300 [Nonlabens tegetincola]
MTAFAVVVALAGTATALAVTRTWPFDAAGAPAGGVASTSQAGGPEQDRPASFADGVEAKWTLRGTDLGAEAALLGHLPRMLGPINEMRRADQPLQLESGVLVHYRPTAGQAGSSASWALIDAETGQARWAEEGWGYPISCASSPDASEAVCSVTAGDGSKLIGFDSGGVSFMEDAQAGSVRYSEAGVRVFSENAIDTYALNGEHRESERVAGIFGGTVGNARMPDCVWLHGTTQTSYVGTGCDAPAAEVLATVDSLSWSVVGETDPVLLLSSGSSVSAFDAETRELLWEISGAIPGALGAPELVGSGAETGVLVVHSAAGESGHAIVNLRTGAVTPIDATGSTAVVVANEVLVFDTARVGGKPWFSVSSVEVFDGVTGTKRATVSFPAIENVAEITGGPLGVLIGHPMCSDCSVAEGSNILDSYTFLAPAEGAGGAAVQRVGNVSIPKSIPAQCPAGTLLLAWAELADGWVLVCGITLDRPSYLAYQPAAGGSRMYSSGATTPTGDTAQAALRFDERLNRYVAQLANGGVLTLDYDIGTVTVRAEAGARTTEQQRLVRYIFVVLGEAVRTVEDAANHDGAFEVQAPADTAEDQIRYMIEVLEKAYAGRALVKDALPKLQQCTAAAGGYGDSVATMQAVRDNRAELLDALGAMPVDRIPRGQELLDHLSAAISNSHAANVEYVAWAEAAQATGCATLSAAGASAAAASDGPKEAFAALWNSAVAAKYGVRTFDARFI